MYVLRRPLGSETLVPRGEPGEEDHVSVVMLVRMSVFFGMRQTRTVGGGISTRWP